MQQGTKKTKKQIIMWLVPILLFLLFVFYVMIRSFSGEAKDAITDTRISFKSFETLTDSFEGTLQENISGRYDYINLNGLVTRTLGINTLNKRYKLANGYLARSDKARDTTKYAGNVIELNDFLSERDIDFLYMSVPTKEAFWDAEYHPGYSSDGWKTLESMGDALTEAGVNWFDINAWFEENDWTMEETYFKTDHHWLPSAALAIADATMQLLVEQGMVDSYEPELLKEDNYTIITLENWFLGSHGKRVGRFYAGVDDMDVYFPDFETNYTFYGLHRDVRDWYYSDSPLKMSIFENKDYFNQNTDTIYLYAENPLQILKNTESAIDKKVLVVGDSFRRPWEYFLSTQFQEIYSIDLRYYEEGTLAEYIEEIQPDLVLMCYNPTSMGAESAYSFGTQEYIEALENTSEVGTEADILRDAKMEAQDENDNYFIVLCDNLEPGGTYTLTVDSTAYSGGEDQFIQMTLRDLSTNTEIYNRYFDANSEETQKWIFTVPEEQSGSYSIFLYAGINGHTSGCAAEVTNVTLLEGIFEE